MTAFIILIVLLVLAVIFFITYPFIKVRIISENYSYFCNKKIKKIADKNNVNFLTDLKLENYNKEKLGIDSIIFGKKYIYIISNLYYDGEIKGDVKNNSWMFIKRGEKSAHYIDNLTDNLSEKTRGFCEKINANPELIVSIGLLNNECFFNIEEPNSANTFIVRYSSLKKLIRQLEERDIKSLDENLLETEYQKLKEEGANN